MLSSSSPSPLLACSHVGGVGENRGGAQPPTHPADCPTPFSSHRCSPCPLPTALAPPPPSPHPPAAPVWWCGYLLPMFNSWLGLGTSFPRKERIPLGSCPVPAHLQGTRLWPPPPAWVWGWESKPLMGLKDAVPARAWPPFVNPQPWNVCGPISKVSKGSPRALIILQ